MFEITPNWHPVLVHFTVAPLLLAVALYLVAVLAGNRAWQGSCLTVARWNLYAGIGFAALTIATGLSAYYSVAHDTPSHAAMTDHRNWAFTTAGLFVVLGVWNWYRSRQNKAPMVIFALALIFAGGLLATTAWKGGELVFQYGLGVQSLPESEGPGHGHSHEQDGHEHGSESRDGSVGHEHGDDARAVASQTDDDHGPADQAHDHDHGTAQSSEEARVTLDTEGPAGVVNAFRAALTSGDQEAVATLLSPDVVIFEGGGAERSLEAYRSHHMAADMQFLAGVTSNVTVQDVHERANHAWVISESRTHGTYQTKEIDSVGTETVILERRDGKWTIVHIHWSSS